MQTEKQQHVVIFGGGIAGAKLAKELSNGARVTLVDPNDYFEVPMAAPRNLVKPAFAEQSIIPFAAALPQVTHVRGKLVEMAENQGWVETAEGQRVQLGGDVNVLATGSFFSNPLMRANGATEMERQRFYRDYQQRIDGANKVLIVGGGPIGVEVAGEISESYPDKAITIVESGPRLLGGTSAEASAHATSVLEQRGVTIITGERVQSSTSTPQEVFSPAGQAHTSAGKVIPYDLIIWCVGGRPNTGYMRPQLAHLLTAQGRIRVTPQLRVEGSETLFALGDITDLDENKMAWHITSQVEHALVNVRRVLGGERQSSRLVAHKPQTGNPMMAVSLGSQQGVLHLPFVGVVRSPWFTRKAKAAHMLVPRYRKLFAS